MIGKVLQKDEILFIEYLRLWHGDHSDCEVAEDLDEYDIGNKTLNDMIEVFDDVDGDWESWGIFKNERHN